MFRYIVKGGLSSLEVEYWKRIAKSNIKVAVELECQFDDWGDVIHKLRHRLNPTENISKFGDCGVHNVHSDGSLQHGAETCTIGRRLSFIDLYEQYKYITDIFMEYKPYITPRAGLHNHFLLDYGDEHNCLEKPMPEIIFKNFLQLLKKYAPALIWLTSTVKHELNGAITRMNYFCSHGSLMSTAIPNKSLTDIRSAVMNGDRYRFINLNWLDFNGEGINKLHFELRFPDCSIFPAQIAAQNILYAALFIKAIELSETGIIACSDSESDWEDIKGLTSRMRDDFNTTNYRISSPLSDEDCEKAKIRAVAMIKELKAEIFYIDKNAYMPLTFLAETPLSKSRHDYTLRNSNQEERLEAIKKINEEYAALIESMKVCHNNESEYENVVSEINSMSITGMSTEKQWIYKAQEVLNSTMSEIEKKITHLKMYRNLKFDFELGTFVF
jgi:hypothetical protein